MFAFREDPFSQPGDKWDKGDHEGNASSESPSGQFMRFERLLRSGAS